MKLAFEYFFVLNFIFFFGLEVSAQRACSAHFLQLSESKIYAGIEYTQIQSRSILQSELIPPGAIAIGLYGFGHTTLFVDGYRIDGYGNAGISVTSQLKKDKWIRRDLLFVINNPPESLLISLREKIDDFQSESRVNCVGLTCDYLMPEGEGNFLPERTIWPIKFTNMLFEIARNNPQFEIDVYTLDDQSVPRIRLEMRRNSIAVPLGLTMGSGVVATIISMAIITVFNQ